MSDDTVFRITYWGTTGAYAAPLRPEEFSRQVRHAIQSLARQNLLSQIQQCHSDDQAVAEIIERNLPFHLHSTWGGNTACIQVETPDSLLVIDSGSGFIELGRQLEQEWSDPDFDGPREANVLLTHSHMDHTLGMPFAPISFDANNRLVVWSAKNVLKSVDAVLNQSAALTGVYFPQSYELLPALSELKAVDVPGTFHIGETEIVTHELNHPGGCTGFRLNCRGRSVVFAFDHEHQATPDVALADWAADADLLCIDAQYRQSEYDGQAGISGGRPMSRAGWGHSTVESAVQTFVKSGANALHLFHRDPTRSDVDLSHIEELAQQLVNDEAARTGIDVETLTVRLPFEGDVTEI